MTVPVWVKPGVWGAVIGAIAIMVLGFWEMGWLTKGTAERMARDRSDAAVVAALVPFCVASAQGDPDVSHLTKLKAEGSSYSRADLVSKAGWATMPGMSSPDQALATACAEKLLSPKA